MKPILYRIIAWTLLTQLIGVGYAQSNLSLGSNDSSKMDAYSARSDLDTSNDNGNDTNKVVHRHTTSNNLIFKCLNLESLDINGEITNESSVSNFRHPFIPADKYYSRFSGYLGLELLNLPFKADFYLTTESQNIYNSNYLTLNLDIDRLKTQMSNKFENKLDALTAKMQKYEDSLNNVKSHQSGLTNLHKDQLNRKESFKEDMEAIIRTNASNRIQSLQDSINDLNQNPIDSLDIDEKRQELNNRITFLESIVNDGVKLDDTLRQIHFEKESLIDSTLLARYQALSKKTNETEQKKATLAAKSEELKSNLARIKEAKDKLKRVQNKSWKSLAMNMSKFNVGTFNPQYSRIALSNISVRGIETAVEFDHFGLDIGIGRAMSMNREFFRNRATKPKFDRNFVGFKYGHKLSKNSTLTYAPVAIWDVYRDIASGFQSNFINSLQYELSAKRLKSEIEITHSSYYESPGIESEKGIIDQWENSSLTYELKNNLAVQSRNQFKLNKTIALKLNGRAIGPGFRSLGNPFLQKDFAETETGISFTYFKNKVESDLMYKYFESNLSNLQDVTNKMRGYGIKTRTKFTKYPNVMLSYLPYDQGNNHPDSLYRTRNQLSVFSAIVTYQKKFSESGVFFALTTVRSDMIFQQLDQSVKNHMYSATAQWFNRKWQMSLTFSSNQTFPIVDSVNYTGGILDIRYNITENYIICGGSSLDLYQNGAHEYYAYTNFSILLKKKILLRPEFRAGKIHNLYQIENQKVLSGTVFITCRF